MHERGHRHRTRTLDHELGALQQQHHGLRHLIVGDRDHLVHVALDQRQREVAGALDGNAVADRVGRARSDRPVRGERVDVGSAGLGLHADHAGAGKLVGQGEPDARRQPAAAQRDHHELDVRALARDLQAGRALPGHDRRLIEGVHHGQALVRGEPPRLGARLVEAALDEAHLAAVLAHRRDLGQRRLRGHHQ